MKEALEKVRPFFPFLSASPLNIFNVQPNVLYLVIACYSGVWLGAVVPYVGTFSVP